MKHLHFLFQKEETTKAQIEHFSELEDSFFSKTSGISLWTFAKKLHKTGGEMFFFVFFVQENQRLASWSRSEVDIWRYCRGGQPWESGHEP